MNSMALSREKKMKKYQLSKFNIYHENLCAVSNTMTGSVLELDEKELKSLKQAMFSEFDNEVMDVLRENGIIVETSCDEKKILRDAYFSCKYDTQNKEKHMTVTIAPSLFCNFNCPYCYERRTTAKMSIEVMNHVCEFVEKEIKNHHIRSLTVCWYGGEPLLQLEIIEILSRNLMRFCESMGVHYHASMITNGYTVSEEVAKRLVQLKVETMQITIDGDKESHNKRRVPANGKETYDIIVKNIFLLAENHIYVNVRVNLDKSNVLKYRDVTAVFQNQENIIYYPTLVTAEDSQSNEQRALCYRHLEYGKFYNEIYNHADSDSRKNMCANFEPGVCNCAAEHAHSYVIDPYGNIYKCLNDICNPERAVGHVAGRVKENDILRNYMERDPFEEEECKDCPFLPMCYGGCMFEYQKHGNHACKAVKYLYEKSILQQVGTAK